MTGRLRGDLACVAAASALAAGPAWMVYNCRGWNRGELFAALLGWVALFAAGVVAVARARHRARWRAHTRQMPRRDRLMARYLVERLDGGDGYGVYDRARSRFVRTFKGDGARQRAEARWRSLTGAAR